MTPPFALALLRRALAANSAFSAVSAVLVVALAPALASHLALSSVELLQLGLQLALFAVLLAWLAMRPRLGRRWTLVAAELAAVADLGWVVASGVALVRGLAWTLPGVALVVLAAAMTGVLGALQAAAAVSLWRARTGGVDLNELAPSPPGRRRLRLAAILGGVVGLLAVLYVVLPWADLRSEGVRRGSLSAGASPEAERGRALLRAAARAHGLEALAAKRTMEVVAVDEWKGSSGWWPAPTQRFRAERLLGTFTSRVELLDGPDAGRIWGLQSWRPYRRASRDAPPELLDEDIAITFYLPTLQYFDELPLRLIGAPVVLDAGDAELAGRRFCRVFATWEPPEPHADHDQYELWLDAETLRIEKVAYTLRDAVDFSSRWMAPLLRIAAVGTMHYGDYRMIDGVLVPFRQTVTLGRPTGAPASLDEGYLHRLTVESVRFDTVPPAALQPIPGLPEPGDRKPG